VRTPALAAPGDGEPSIRTGHQNARLGEPEGLPDLTSKTLSQLARSCQAVAEAVAVDADGVDDAGPDRAIALAALEDGRVERDVRVGSTSSSPVRSRCSLRSCQVAEKQSLEEGRFGALSKPFPRGARVIFRLVFRLQEVSASPFGWREPSGSARQCWVYQPGVSVSRDLPVRERVPGRGAEVRQCAGWAGGRGRGAVARSVASNASTSRT
jgi:hypothetical protein